MAGSSTKVAENAQELLALGFSSAEVMKARQAERKALTLNTTRPDGLGDAGSFYENQLSWLVRRYGANLDCSRADWMIVTKMVKLGYSEGEVRDALEAHSPALNTRKGNHAEKYLSITVANAFRNRSRLC